MLAGIRDYNRLLCASAPGARLLELEGAMATVMAFAPRRSTLNMVVYERADALAAALGEIAEAYREAGVEAWGVWVPAVDAQASRLLRRAGHRLEPDSSAMALELRGFKGPAGAALADWTADGDPAVMAAIADRAFLFGDAFRRAFSGLERGRARIYLASVEREPVSCVMTSDHSGDCAVDMVATVPEARGRGLAGALLARALADAAQRGCETSTLVATARGRPVYERLGYRSVCPLHRWERRVG